MGPPRHSPARLCRPAGKVCRSAWRRARASCSGACAKADLSFNRLLDETGQQLLLHYLRNPALELAEIAFLVGLGEPASLVRAFRRWTGRSPRRQLLP